MSRWVLALPKESQKGVEGGGGSRLFPMTQSLGSPKGIKGPP